MNHYKCQIEVGLAKKKSVENWCRILITLVLKILQTSNICIIQIWTNQIQFVKWNVRKMILKTKLKYLKSFKNTWASLYFFPVPFHSHPLKFFLALSYTSLPLPFFLVRQEKEHDLGLKTKKHLFKKVSIDHSRFF